MGLKEWEELEGAEKDVTYVNVAILEGLYERHLAEKLEFHKAPKRH